MAKRLTFTWIFIKASKTKINIYGELQMMNGNKIVSLNLLCPKKKKKTLNQAFDRTKSVGFFYCQFNY